jgi:ADP-heptose:LPS heptosyltransferase
MHEPAKFLFLLQQAGLIPPMDIESVSSRPSLALQEVAAGVNWNVLAARLGIDGHTKFAIVAPGASMPRRVWPIENWIEVITFLNGLGLGAIVLSGPQDTDVARRLHGLCTERSLRTMLVAGVTNPLESAALASHADLFLGNDSGPGHVAGSLGIPTVVLFTAASGCDVDHPTAPERVRPSGPYIALCRPNVAVPPCQNTCSAEAAHCIKSIAPETVIAAVEHILATCCSGPQC